VRTALLAGLAHGDEAQRGRVVAGRKFDARIVEQQAQQARAALQGLAQGACVQGQVRQRGKAADLEAPRVEAEELIVKRPGDLQPQGAEGVGRHARFIGRQQRRVDAGALQERQRIEALARNAT
jgi:hypothetical protein